MSVKKKLLELLRKVARAEQAEITLLDEICQMAVDSKNVVLEDVCNLLRQTLGGGVAELSMESNSAFPLDRKSALDVVKGEARRRDCECLDLEIFGEILRLLNYLPEPFHDRLGFNPSAVLYHHAQALAGERLSGDLISGYFFGLVSRITRRLVALRYQQPELADLIRKTYSPKPSLLRRKLIEWTGEFRELKLSAVLGTTAVATASIFTTITMSEGLLIAQEAENEQQQFDKEEKNDLKRVAWIRTGIGMELIANGTPITNVEIFQGQAPEDLAISGVRRLYPDLLYTIKPASEPSQDLGRYVHDAETMLDGTVRAKFILAQPFAKLRQAAELLAKTREAKWYEQAGQGKPIDLLIERLPVQSIVFELRDQRSGTLAWALVSMRGKTDEVPVYFEFSRPAWAQYLSAEKSNNLELRPIYRASHMKVAIATQQVSGNQNVTLDVRNLMAAQKIHADGPITLDQIDSLAKVVGTQMQRLVSCDDEDVYLMLLPPTSLVGGLFEQAGQLDFADLVSQNPEAKSRIAAVLEANGFVKSTGKVKVNSELDAKTRENITDIQGGLEVMFPIGTAVGAAGLQAGTRERAIESLARKTGIHLSEGFTENGLRPFKIDTYRLASGKSSISLSQCGQVVLGKGESNDKSYFVGSSINPSICSLEALTEALDNSVRENLIIAEEISEFDQASEKRECQNNRLQKLVDQQMTELQAFQNNCRDILAAKSARNSIALEIELNNGTLYGIGHARELLFEHAKGFDEGEAGKINTQYLKDYAPARSAEIMERITKLKAELESKDLVLAKAIDSLRQQKAGILSLEQQISACTQHLKHELDFKASSGTSQADDLVSKRILESINDAENTLRSSNEILCKEIVTERLEKVSKLIEACENLTQIGTESFAVAAEGAFREGKLQSLRAGLAKWYEIHFGYDKEEAEWTRTWMTDLHIKNATNERDACRTKTEDLLKSEVDGKKRNRSQLEKEWIDTATRLAEIKSRSLTLFETAKEMESNYNSAYRKFIKEKTKH